MQLAITAAGFSPGEADGLRRAMAAWKRDGRLAVFESRLIEGMLRRGYAKEFAQRIVRQIRGFGEYGFPESHAASFALLVYVSAWLKCHEPAAFFCALLNSQPMGFYAPAQLLRAAGSHGVELRPIDVNRSAWDSSLEPDVQNRPAIRLGQRLVKGLSAAAVKRVVECRRIAPFESIRDLAARAELDARDLAALAAGGALKGLAGHRHQARWAVAGVQRPASLLKEIRIPEGIPLLRAPTRSEDVAEDYRSTGLSLAHHPLALLRERLEKLRVKSLQAALEHAHGTYVRTAGLVITRQRPGSAAGVTFVTLEDETSYLNLIVWRTLAERQRQVLLGARLLGVAGRIQRQGAVIHLVAERLEDHSNLLNGLVARSRDFH
jgi:error-prone DNA polymerase